MLDRFAFSLYTYRNCIRAMKQKERGKPPQSEPGRVEARPGEKRFAAAEPSARTPKGQ